MKRMIRGMLIVSLLIVLQAVPARADVTKVSGGLGCGTGSTNALCNPDNPVRVQQGKTVSLRVVGQDVNFADKNNVAVTGAGVSARITQDYLIAPSFGLGTGGVDVEVNVGANAAAGVRTVTLNHNCLGCSTPRRYNFQIRVVHAGRITGVSGTEPNDFFREVNLTFTGERLGDAGVTVIPPSTPTSVIGGAQIPQVITTANPDGTTAEIIENTETRIVVKLSFPELRAETTQRLQFFDKNCNCSVYQGLTNNFFSDVNIRAKDNFVQTIEFPDGNRVTVGGVLSIKVKLARPASSVKGTIGLPTTVGRQGVQGETVHWQLVPANVFEAAPGSGIPFSPTGLNQVRILPGNDFVILTVRLAEVPGGCPQQGCNGQIQTRMNNLNSDQPPFFKSASFTMVPPAGND